ILLVTFSYVANAQNSFEGELLLRTENCIKGYKEDASITWYIKNDKHRMDYNIEGKYSISYTITVNNNVANMYSKKEGKNIITPLTLNPTDVVTNYTINSTDKNVKLASFTCTKYNLTLPDGTLEIWLAEKTQLTIKSFPAFMQNAYLKIISGLDSQAFPVKIVKNDNSGKLVFSQTITSIDAKTVPDSIFVIQ
ncbi:MAG: DUF4412 domain-containing protein, partial [Bacteroidetes bacterium]|nr:DUF4412 domain-containing protein [Bacteroidota bacterium]